MHSTAFGWKKQAPSEMNASTRSERSYSRPPRKIAPLKQQPTSKAAKENHSDAATSKKRRAEDRPYDTLSATSSALDMQPPHDRRLCSVRAAIATFIAIVVLIIAAAIALGIVFGVISSQKNSSKTASNNQNSVTTVSTGSVTSSISIGSQNGVPCSGYTEINDPTRNINTAGLTTYCDNGPVFNTTSGAAWIRFVGNNGTALATSSPGLNHCGAFLAGWYNDTLLILPNTQTNGTVCFETHADACGYAVDISVVLCSPGNFYVFRLPPLSVCSARYCIE